MLFTESQLQMDADPFAILDEATYLTEEEATIQPQMVPVMESSNIGCYHVPFYALRSLVESDGSSILDAISKVGAINGVDPSEIVVSIAEEEAITNPEVVQELGSAVVIVPISTRDPIYQLCEAIIEEYTDTLDESILSEDKMNDAFHDTMGELNAISARWTKRLSRAKDQSERDRINAKYQAEMNSASEHGQERVKRYQSEAQKRRDENAAKRSSSSSTSGNSGTTSSSNASTTKTSNTSQSDDSRFLSKTMRNLGLAAIGAGGIGLALHQSSGNPILAYKNRPKSVIAKKIASFRALYAKVMHRFQNASDSGIKNRLKHVAAKILEIIDKLLGFLQRKADGR